MTTKLSVLRRLLTSISSNHAILRHSSGVKFYQHLKEKQPYDIDYSEGFEQVIPPHQPPRTSFLETRDVNDWKAVENILPPSTIPTPPSHASYPTPSGWFPPKGLSDDQPYIIRRTKYHNFPLFYRVLNGGNRRFTVVNKVMGDIRQFDTDLRTFLEAETKTKVYTMVNEVCSKLWVRGVHMDLVEKFLTMKGF